MCDCVCEHGEPHVCIPWENLLRLWEEAEKPVQILNLKHTWSRTTNFFALEDTTKRWCASIHNGCSFVHTAKEQHFVRVGQFSCTPLSGNHCGVIEFHGVDLFKEWRGMGLGKLLLRLRTEAYALAGFQLALATVRDDNLRERNLLKGLGWKKGVSFDSKNHIGGTVSLWTKNL